MSRQGYLETLLMRLSQKSSLVQVWFVSTVKKTFCPRKFLKCFHPLLYGVFCSQTLIIFSLCKFSLSFVSLILHQKASFSTIFPHHLQSKVGNYPQLNSEGLNSECWAQYQTQTWLGRKSFVVAEQPRAICYFLSKTFTTSVSHNQLLFDFLTW